MSRRMAWESWCLVLAVARATDRRRGLAKQATNLWQRFVLTNRAFTVLAVARVTGSVRS
jgi:hypothetical protein